jgi:hypothetical protein
VRPCRLYIDEDASDADLVAALRNRHVDVVTTWEAGLREVRVIGKQLLRSGTSVAAHAWPVKYNDDLRLCASLDSR